MQSVIKLMPEPIPEVPREAPRDSGVSTSNDYGGHSSGFSQEFDHQVNQYNDRNPHGGSNQQAHADFPDDNGNHQKDERQQMTADQLRELAKESQEQSAKDAKGGIAADSSVGKQDQPITKPAVLAQAPKESSALDALVAMVEDAEKLIRSDKSGPNIDSEFLKQNKLTHAMDQALIGKQGDKRGVVDVLKGFAQSGAQLDSEAAETGKKSGQDPELAKLLGQLKGQNTSEKAASASSETDEQAMANKLLAAGDKLQQGKAGQANLVIPGESESQSGPKPLDLLKTLNGHSQDAESKLQGAAKTVQQNAEQLTNTKADSTKQDTSIADLLAANSSKGEKGENAQTKPMELAGDKVIKPAELVADKQIKPTQLSGSNGANTVDEQSIAADEALAKLQTQANSGKANTEQAGNQAAEQLKAGAKQPTATASQTIDTIDKAANLQTHDQAAEHVNQVANAGQATSASQSVLQAKSQTIVTGDKRQNILGKNVNAKGGNDAQASVNSEKLAQMANQELQKQQGEQQLDDSQTGSDGVFDEMMQTTLPKDAPLANTKVASQFGQTLNQFSNDSATRLNATTQTLSATGTEKTPPQVTETLQMTRPDLSVNMKERMTLMMRSGIQTADIRLDPAELGQMQVKMSVENDVTSVSFVVQNSQAKELLEKALPQLKEMLAEQGVEMGESSVSQQDKQQQQLGDGEGHGQGQMAGNGHNEPEVEEGAIVQQVSITNGAVGGIDFFA